MPRELRRFFLQRVPTEDLVRLDLHETHHLRDVLRLRAGDRVLLVDSSGDQTQAVIEELGSRGALLRVEQRSPAKARKGLLWLATAIPKGERADFLVEKCTELGLDRLTPLVTERSVLPASAILKRSPRWERIAREALKQSRQNRPPLEIDPPCTLQTLAARSAPLARVRLLGSAEATDDSPDAKLSSADLESCLVTVGPEGGFTRLEADLLARNGFLSVRLGQSVLRVETACVALVAVIQHRRTGLCPSSRPQCAAFGQPGESLP